MQIPLFKDFKKSCNNETGFSLAELMVVMVIAGILAIGVVFMFSDPTAKVKAAAFEMRGDFNLARAEAVTENVDVRIDFDTANNSYRIWLDDWHEASSIVGPPPQDNIYTPDSDTLVKEVFFKDKVVYYDFTGTVPANGPVNDPLGTALSGKSGITLGATTLTFSSNGTCDHAGSVVVYYPEDGNPATSNAKGRPYAVIVDNVSTGAVRLERWRPDLNAWSRK